MIIHINFSEKCNTRVLKTLLQCHGVSQFFSEKDAGFSKKIGSR